MKKIYFQLMLAVFLTPAIYAGTYSGGSGTSGAPYQIATTDDLIELSNTSGDWSAFFIQTADIEFDADETAVDWDGDGNPDGSGTSGFSPIGNFTTNFTGTYDGQGFTITNLYIYQEYGGNMGLFGITINATLSNIGLIDMQITGSTYTGGLVGYDQTGSSIYNCYAQGGSVTSNGDRVGGLIGGSAGTITKCYSATTVYLIYNTSYCGGFIGDFSGYHGNSLSNCYNLGSIILDNEAAYSPYGGFAGRNIYGTITNCYSAVTITGAVNNWHGFIGENDGGTNNNCFFDATLSGQTSGSGATAKTTAEMTTESTFTVAGWDFTNTWAIDASRNDGYPYLDWQSFPPTDITWDGSESTDWNTADNWDLGTVPTFDHNVIIPVTSNDPVVGASGSASCTNLTINENATLTVNAGGTLITNGTITSNGTVNIKQSLTEDGKWHFISIPNNATTANTFFDMYLQQWNESTTGWEDITDPITNLTPVKGYSLWMPGGAKMDFTYTGTPLTGEQSISLTSSGSGESAGMNLVGNPYPSYIDWGQVSGYGSKYTWNGIGYDTYVYIPDQGYGTGSQYIAPMEGFFIYTASAKDFDLNNSMRCHLPVGKSGSNLFQNGLVLEANNGSYRDALWILFRAEANEGFEISRDAWKILSGTNGLSQLWSENPDGMLSVDVRPETETIQLGFTNNEAGTYSIGIKEIADISTAILEDTKLNVFYDLKEGEYTFDWSLTDNETRFKLHFNTTAVEEISGSAVQAYVADGNIIIQSESPAERVTLTDITGRTLGVWENTKSIPAPETTGVYLVTVETDHNRTTKKIIVE